MISKRILILVLGLLAFSCRGEPVSTAMNWPESVADRIQLAGTTSELSQIWRSLGLQKIGYAHEMEMQKLRNEMNGETNVEEQVEERTKNYPAVKQIHYENPSHDSQFRVISVKDPRNSWSWRYLVFSWTNGLWRLRGALDYCIQKYEDPKIHLVETGEKVWFVIRYLAGTGTGICEYEETWHNPMATGCPVVLSYPVDVGYYSYEGYPHAIDRQVAGKSKPGGKGALLPQVSVDFKADYLIPDPKTDAKHKLLTVSKQAVFIWDAETQRFQMDRERSQFRDTKEIGALLGDDEKAIIEKNMEALIKVVKTANPVVRESLRRMTMNFPDSPALLRLKEVVNKKKFGVIVNE